MLLSGVPEQSRPLPSRRARGSRPSATPSYRRFFRSFADRVPTDTASTFRDAQGKSLRGWVIGDKHSSLWKDSKWLYVLGVAEQGTPVLLFTQGFHDFELNVRGTAEVNEGPLGEVEDNLCSRLLRNTYLELGRLERDPSSSECNRVPACWC